MYSHGQRWRPKHAREAAISRVIRDSKQRPRGAGGAPLPPRTWGEGVHLVQNKSGVFRDRFSVMAVKWDGVIPRPEENTGSGPTTFTRRRDDFLAGNRVLLVDLLDDVQGTYNLHRVCVLQEPAKPDGIVPAVFIGVTSVKIIGRGMFARHKVGSTVFSSNSSAGWPVLYGGPSTGGVTDADPRWAIVQLGGTSSQCNLKWVISMSPQASEGDAELGLRLWHGSTSSIATLTVPWDADDDDLLAQLEAHPWIGADNDELTVSGGKWPHAAFSVGLPHVNLDGDAITKVEWVFVSGDLYLNGVVRPQVDFRPCCQ